MADSSKTDPRMDLFLQREEEFYAFMKESASSDHQADSLNAAEKKAAISRMYQSDQPLTGLQCLFALSAILDTSVRLKQASHNLEEEIKCLRKFKELLEVQNSLLSHKAGVDLNFNTVTRKKTAPPILGTVSAYDITPTNLQRARSEEHVDGGGRKGDSLDDRKGHALKLGKKEKKKGGSSKIKRSKTNVGDHTYKSIGPALLGFGNDMVSGSPVTMRNSTPRSRHLESSRFSADNDSLLSLNSASALSQSSFTQREIVISTVPSGDFGGVWLGDDEDACKDKPGAIPEEFGGVFIGPPLFTQNSLSETKKENLLTLEEARKKISEPGRPTPTPDEKEPSFTQRASLDNTAAARRAQSLGGRANRTISDKVLDFLVPSSPDKPNLTLKKSPTPDRKAAIISSTHPVLTGTSTASRQGSTSSDKDGKLKDLKISKDFAKKMEKWNQKKHSTGSREKQPEKEKSMRPANPTPSKETKVKAKTQRFKNRKRTALLKGRSKSADRAGGSEDDLFTEKLREWSILQGRHPEYYFDTPQKDGSMSSMKSLNDEDLQRPLQNSDESLDDRALRKSESESFVPKHPELSSRDRKGKHNSRGSTPSRSVALAESTQSLNPGIRAQSPVSPRPSRVLKRNRSRSEETLLTQIYRPASSPGSSATTSSHDVYAEATESSLEKHLSLQCLDCGASSDNMEFETEGCNVEGEVQLNSSLTASKTEELDTLIHELTAYENASNAPIITKTEQANTLEVSNTMENNGERTVRVDIALCNENRSKTPDMLVVSVYHEIEDSKQTTDAKAPQVDSVEDAGLNKILDDIVKDFDQIHAEALKASDDLIFKEKTMDLSIHENTTEAGKIGKKEIDECLFTKKSHPENENATRVSISDTTSMKMNSDEESELEDLPSEPTSLTEDYEFPVLEVESDQAPTDHTHQRNNSEPNMVENDAAFIHKPAQDVVAIKSEDLRKPNIPDIAGFEEVTLLISQRRKKISSPAMPSRSDLLRTDSLPDPIRRPSLTKTNSLPDSQDLSYFSASPTTPTSADFSLCISLRPNSPSDSESETATLERSSDTEQREVVKASSSSPEKIAVRPARLSSSESAFQCHRDDSLPSFRSSRSYDINCNQVAEPEHSGLNNRGSILSLDGSAGYITAPTTPLDDPVYLGPEVPLKIKLKSLALAYQAEDAVRLNRTNELSSSSNKNGSFKKKDCLGIKSNRVQHMRSRSNDELSPTMPFHPLTSCPDKNHRFGNLVPRKTSVTRLKSASDLLEEKSYALERMSPRDKHEYDLKSSKPGLGNLKNSRTHNEIPKAGTVQKARSAFISATTAPAHFGTDFSKLSAPTPALK